MAVMKIITEAVKPLTSTPGQLLERATDATDAIGKSESLLPKSVAITVAVVGMGTMIFGCLILWKKLQLEKLRIEVEKIKLTTDSERIEVDKIKLTTDSERIEVDKIKLTTDSERVKLYRDWFEYNMRRSRQRRLAMEADDQSGDGDETNEIAGNAASGPPSLSPPVPDLIELGPLPNEDSQPTAHASGDTDAFTNDLELD